MNDPSARAMSRCRSSVSTCGRKPSEASSCWFECACMPTTLHAAFQNDRRLVRILSSDASWRWSPPKLRTGKPLDESEALGCRTQDGATHIQVFRRRPGDQGQAGLAHTVYGALNVKHRVTKSKTGDKINSECEARGPHQTARRPWNKVELEVARPLACKVKVRWFGCDRRRNERPEQQDTWQWNLIMDLKRNALTLNPSIKRLLFGDQKQFIECAATAVSLSGHSQATEHASEANAGSLHLEMQKMELKTAFKQFGMHGTLNLGRGEKTRATLNSSLSLMHPALGMKTSVQGELCTRAGLKGWTVRSERRPQDENRGLYLSADAWRNESGLKGGSLEARRNGVSKAQENCELSRRLVVSIRDRESEAQLRVAARVEHAELGFAQMEAGISNQGAPFGGIQVRRVVPVQPSSSFCALAVHTQLMVDARDAKRSLVSITGNLSI
ncbi:hypothetical protein FVE85_4507 [Porphyridium purpureum]|uniref:Uncharacterized protein n=1 Tax=Porphyridium purpureum TaxID=35688 RepID=A0A5J4YJQ8_PORPP|nr:hypothetical protein FVE85_4507 [Porphyridium purpureum]|eukprot:POR0707..scf297_16